MIGPCEIGDEMSWQQFVTARCRIYLDEVGSDRVVAGIRTAVDRLPEHWDIDESKFEQTDGYVDISIEVQGETNRSTGSIVGEAMEAINGLEGKSGGVVIYESDFGIDGYDLFGAAAAKDVSLSDARGLEWHFEDFLRLRVSMIAKDWRDVLGNNDESLSDAIEVADVDLLRKKLMPAFFTRIEEESDEIAFQFWDLEPYAPEEEYSDDEMVTAIYEFDGHDLSGRAFELLLNSVMQDAAGLDRNSCKVSLSLSNAKSENGKYRNTVVDTGNIAFLEFTSSENAISSIRAFAIDGVGCTGPGSV